MYFISKNNITETLRISKLLLSDKEDLMHKAVGWTLREAWKKQPQEVENFLKDNYTQIPRTTLRYTIERMEESKRKMFLRGVF
jgi:3-methyladenine DNA glycosylase AlkD